MAKYEQNVQQSPAWLEIDSSSVWPEPTENSLLRLYSDDYTRLYLHHLALNHIKKLLGVASFSPKSLPASRVPLPACHQTPLRQSHSPSFLRSSFISEDIPLLPSLISLTPLAGQTHSPSTQRSAAQHRTADKCHARDPLHAAHASHLMPSHQSHPRVNRGDVTSTSPSPSSSTSQAGEQMLVEGGCAWLAVTGSPSFPPPCPILPPTHTHAVQEGNIARRRRRLDWVALDWVGLGVGVGVGVGVG
ncbi:hypothetical protein IWX90DRAFT_309336 [Phyllosticta citrichinensis]|uniref:Uncharacterized protein n=1 Tax=Phyllosticta citrichinensis TaxID=1130410 RepID=A0ABR1XLW7_9PEZI